MTAIDDIDRATLDRARRLAAAVTHDQLAAFFAAEPLGPGNPLAAHLGNGDGLKARALTLAQCLLADVVRIAERPADRTALQLVDEHLARISDALADATRAEIDDISPAAAVARAGDEVVKGRAVIRAALRSSEPR